jgi:hypothetical protein
MRTASIVGPDIAVIAKAAPDAALVTYWKKYFASVPQFQIAPEGCPAPSEQGLKHVVLFPHPHLEEEQYLIDPSKHYYLLGKEAIMESKVTQPYSYVVEPHATNMESIKLPFVVKSTHGLSGGGTWLVRTEEQRESVTKMIYKQKYDKVIISDMIQDVVHNYCLQFYVSKRKENDIFIGATRQIVDECGGWEGGIINFSEQEYLEQKLKNITEHMSEYLRGQGYFGVVGVDVLEDRNEKMWVIDLNPRVNGSTPMCLLSKHMMSINRPLMSYLGEIKFKGMDPDNVLDSLSEFFYQSSVVLLGLANLEDEKSTSCFVMISGRDMDDLAQVEKTVRNISDNFKLKQDATSTV